MLCMTNTMPMNWMPLRSKVKTRMAETGESIYAEAIHTELTEKFFGTDINPYIADATMIVDDPQKLLEKVSQEQKIVATAIAHALNEAEKEIIIYTPYFIPGKNGLALLESIAAKGVRIVLVTNSLATNNHTSVHSAYSSYRKPLLQGRGGALGSARQRR